MEATNVSFVSEHTPTDASAELNTTGAGPGGLGAGLGTGLGGFANWFPGPNSPYTPVKAVLIALLLLCVVIVTFVGNVLVCVAVCLVRKLRRPCNYLLVSLAVSDICVAILVMPMALLYEVMGRWDFGRLMCNLWVSFDVLSCTASILNLCMISVDRYYAITKPLEYGVKRTPRRMIACVSLVWLGAACISLPPLLILGNEHDPADQTNSGSAPAPQCIVCQNFGYQIYATLLSFYIPLTVMIVVYYKIFRAARRIVLEERRAQTHLETHSYVQAVPPPATNNGCMANNRNSLSSHSLLVGEADAAGAGGCPGGAGGEGRDAAQPTRHSTGCDASGGGSRCFAPRRSDESQCPMLGAAPNRSPTQTSASSLSVPRRGRLAAAKKAAKAARRSPASTMSLLRQHRHSSTMTPANTANPTGGPPIAATSHTKKLRFALAKERKASTTLGIIMSAFIVCWLPFFVLALVRPFLKDGNSIPPSVVSLFLWLGYANSLLNPIIYATLNRDFRRPFQQILYFRCGSLNHMMREEFYQSQYGDPDPTPNYYHVTSQCVVGRITPPPPPPPPSLPPSQPNDDVASDLASDEETLTSGGLITVTGNQRDRNAANESFL